MDKEAVLKSLDYWKEFKKELITLMSENKDEDIINMLLEQNKQVDYIIDSFERLIPKQVIWTEPFQSYISSGDESEALCPNCNAYGIEDDQAFCKDCGQALDYPWNIAPDPEKEQERELFELASIYEGNCEICGKPIYTIRTICDNCLEDLLEKELLTRN